MAVTRGVPTATNIDFTVAIPTYNGAARLPAVLERLRSQVNTDSFSWEVIVVDNNSSDQTATVVRAFQTNWLKHCPLRYCLEIQQGAAFARQQAVEQAQGQLIGFLDDDNLPMEDWVAQALAFGQTHPDAGAYGSRISGDFEVEPPPEFSKLACFLAIVDRGLTPHIYEPYNKMLPPGAGLVVRRQVWLQTVPRQLVLNNRGKAAGLASEDLEVLLHIQRAGWQIWYNPAMQVDHKIPGWRLEKDYLLSLVRCVGLSRHHLRMLRLDPWLQPLAFLAYLLNDLRRLVVYFLQHGFRQYNSRGHSQPGQPHTQYAELIAACELELLLSSLLSPFFLLRTRYWHLFRSRFGSYRRLRHLINRVVG